MRRHAAFGTVLSTLLVSILTACGGSSGSPAPTSEEPDPTTLVGTYFMVSLSARYETEGSGEPVVSAGYGTATSDGRGTFTAESDSTRTYTGDPVLEPPGGTRPVPYAYEEDEEGNITFSVTLSDTVHVVGQGVVTADGSIAVFASLPPFPPGMSLLLRRDEAYSPASFTGEHQFVAWTTRSDGGTNTTSSGEASLSTPDALELDFEEENKEGDARAGAGLHAGGWETYGEGSLDMWMDAGPSTFTYRGGGGGEGTIQSLGGCLLRDHGPALWVLLRRATGLTRSSFNGRYRVVGLQHLLARSEYRSVLGTLSTDGEGLFQFSGRANVEGVSSLFAPLGGSYTLASDGTLSLPLVGSGMHVGALSASGDFAILAGSTTPGQPPGIFLLLRP